MTTDVGDLIRDLIERRKSRLPLFIRWRNDLAELDADLRQVERLLQGPECSDPSLDPVRNRLESVIQDADAARSTLDDLYRRFAKNTIDIAVAGAARQGKSTLLRNLAEIPPEAIPAESGLVCTAAKSRIVHCETDPYAVVHFYSETDFYTEIVSGYVSEVYGTEVHAMPRSLDEFAEMLLPPPPDGSDRERRRLLWEELNAIQKAFNKHRSLLSRRELTIKLEDVPNYVRKNPEDGRHYLVDRVDVYVPFAERGLTGLAMIDLPGLFEVARGPALRLAKALRHEADAVCLVKFPKDTGDDFLEPDMEVFKRIRDAVPDLDLSDWVFLVLNRRDDEKNVHVIHALIDRMPEALKDLRVLNICCNDPSEVRTRLLGTILDHLRERQAELDKMLVAGVRRRLDDVATGALSLVEDARGRIAQPDKPNFSEFSRLLVRIKDRLERVVQNQFERYQKNEPQDEFRNVVEQAYADAQHYAEEELRKQDFSRDLNIYGSFPEALGAWLHVLRTRMSLHFADRLDTFLRDLVASLRSELSNAIMSWLPDDVPPEQARTWLQTIRDTIADYPERFPNLRKGFELLDTFVFDYQTHFHHLVRRGVTRALDLRPLEGEPMPIPDFTKVPVSEQAELLCENLVTRYQVAATRVRSLLLERDCDVAIAAYALVEEVKDRLVRSENYQEEWWGLVELLPDILGDQRQRMPVRRLYRSLNTLEVHANDLKVSLTMPEGASDV